MPDLRALVAASLKEWRLVRRYPTFLAGSIFWPLILPGVYVLQAAGFSGGDQRSLGAFAAHTGTVELAGFLYVGWAIYMWISLVLWGPGTSLRTQQVQGQLEAIFLTPASRLAVLFGPSAAYLILALFQFTVVGLALRLGFQVSLGPAAVVRALSIVAVAVPTMYGLGALFATAVLRFREVNGLVQVVRGLFTTLCGITFPIIILPDWARDIAQTLPPTHIIAGIRAALLSGAQLAQLAPDAGALLLSGTLLSVLAVVAFRATERYARRGGTLVQY